MVEVPDSWEGYTRTVVAIKRPGAGDVVVRPLQSGTGGEWPWPTVDPVFLVTAWDPGDDRPGELVNRRRQVALEDDLRPLVRDMWVAVGTDPVTGRREEGVAVSGVDEEVVLQVAARYRQDAVFVWTPASWDTVSCHGGRRETGGWVLGV